MKTKLLELEDKGVKYPALAFMCPGCGLHMLAVNTDKKSPSWNWDENLERPTLSPSILTSFGINGRCHSFLRDGIFEFLSDCTHALKGRHVEMPDLPEWFVKEE